MKDERLRKFQGWLEAKRDDPHAVLALRRITDFGEYTEEDEVRLRQFKDWLKSQVNTPEISSAREGALLGTKKRKMTRKG
jgi:hypothetical protein